MFENRINIEGRSRVDVSFSTTAAQSPILRQGVYAVWSSADCFIKVDATNAADVTTSTGFKITANAPVMPILVPRDGYIGAVGSGSGTLSIHRIN